MKNKIAVVVLVLVVSFVSGQALHPSATFARDNGSEEIEDATSGNSGVIRNQETSSTTRVENEQNQEENDDSEDINDDNVDNGSEHLNQVEKITHKLQEVSDEHDAVNSDLNEIIGEMASSSKDASEAIDGLDNEGAVKKFFFGPDLKSLGELRSTIATTQNHIDRLTKAQEKVTDPAAKATLETQIAALKDVASSTQEFVNTHERVFSIFGWFVKLFSND